MSEWLPYPRDRKIMKKEDYSVIVPAGHDETKNGMPLFCDICSFSFSTDDEKSYEMFGCCSSCADMWAYSHKNEWKQGWRPSEDQIKNVIQKRIFVDGNIRFE